MIQANAGFIIRQATAEDADDIAQLKRLVWKEERSDTDQIVRALSDASHESSIAVMGSAVIGFVDGFTTPTRCGLLRWEVDLLAVHPQFRNQGCAGRLIRASISGGKRRLAQFARALIQVDNHSSQRVFLRCGFQPLNGIYELCISRHGIEERVTPEKKPPLITVNTFNYRGAWLEPPLNENSMCYARSVQHRGSWDIVGAVIPKDEEQMIRAAEDSGFVYVGSYQWWRIDY